MFEIISPLIWNDIGYQQEKDWLQQFLNFVMIDHKQVLKKSIPQKVGDIHGILYKEN